VQRYRRRSSTYADGRRHKGRAWGSRGRRFKSCRPDGVRAGERPSTDVVPGLCHVLSDYLSDYAASPPLGKMRSIVVAPSSMTGRICWR
jgi:hypothetical protein